MGSRRQSPEAQLEHARRMLKRALRRQKRAEALTATWHAKVRRLERERLDIVQPTLWPDKNCLALAELAQATESHEGTTQVSLTAEAAGGATAPPPSEV